MMSNVYIEIKIVLRGGAAIQEHPAPHDDETYASVWRTDLQRCICSTAPCAQQVRIQQWKFGATAVKPTVLRTMGISRAAGILHRHEVPGAVKPTNPFLLILNVPLILKTGIHLQFPKISVWPI